MGWINVSGIKASLTDTILPTGSNVLALTEYGGYIHAIVVNPGGSTTVWRHVGPRATTRWQAIYPPYSSNDMTLPTDGAPYDIGGWAVDTTLNRLYISNRTNKTVYYSTGGSWTAASTEHGANNTINQLAFFHGRLFLAHDKGIFIYHPKTGPGTIDSWLQYLAFFGDSFNCYGLFSFKGRLHTTLRDGSGNSYVYRLSVSESGWEPLYEIPEDSAQYLAEWGQYLFVTCDEVNQSIFSNRSVITSTTDSNALPILDFWKQLKGVPSSALLYPKDLKLYISTWDYGHETDQVTPIVNYVSQLTATTNEDIVTTTTIPSISVESNPPYTPATFADINSSTGGFLVDYPATNIGRTEIKRYKMTTDALTVIGGESYEFLLANRFNGVIKFVGPYLTLTKCPQLKVTIQIKDRPDLSSYSYTISSARDFLDSNNQVDYFKASWTIPTGMTSLQIEVIATVSTENLTAQESVLFSYCNLTLLSFAYFDFNNLTALQSTYIEPSFISKSPLGVPLDYTVSTESPSPPDEWFVKFPIPPSTTPANKIISREIKTNVFNIIYGPVTSGYIFRCIIKYKNVSNQQSGPNNSNFPVVTKLAPINVSIKYFNDINNVSKVMYTTTLNPTYDELGASITWTLDTSLGYRVTTTIPIYIVITAESNPADGDINSEFDINDLNFTEASVDYPQNLMYRYDGVSWDHERSSKGLPTVASGNKGPHSLITYNDVASNSGQRLYCIHNNEVYLWALRGDPGVDPRDLDEGRRLVIDM